ncbi:WG repeat-containing protein [Streptomyces atratus]|uniref:Uncharacterized protein n=1 Tax=Streptomyces atratus TaxID=1893 RepID=A0A2Z5J7E3_STRAR|nr:WG repeat-containing protein [Streptomyces atratus]AXE76123.1 hypothetical protein C5746_03115 [Streptomyces atratus]
MTEIVSRWREFEKMLAAEGFGWALAYAPADLRHARSADHPHGARLDHLLSADYRAFVAEIGYPVIGFSCYDREGISFLPPEPMAVLSTMVVDLDGRFPEAVEGEPTTCPHAFFAGTDLSDICGYALAEDGVWLVEDSLAVTHLGSFTKWLLGFLADQEERVAGLGAEEFTEPDRAADPHRLFDYSLSGFAAGEQSPYSAADLELSWVEQQADNPYSYGLIDAEGRWRIPMGKQYVRVRPFRDETAEVILNVPGSTYAGPWTRIDPDGRIIGI